MTGANIRVNGASRALTAATLGELLGALGIEPGRPGVAVAHNGAVVRAPEWPSTRLAPDDEVEVIQARQGG